MATLAAEPLDVILRDGATLRLRAPGPEDTDALLDFFRRLSQQSLYRRFHGFPEIDGRLVEPLTSADPHEAAALIGCVDDRIVAVANFARLRDPKAAEVAFAVADDYQRRGIGTRLLEQLAARAGELGIERFVAVVLPDNRQMLGVFEAVGFAVARDIAGGEVELTFPIAPTERYLESVESRDHEAVVASLRPFFEPASVAVVGASSRRGSIGGKLFRNVLAADFTGAAYPVNRQGESVAGVRGYAAVAEIPDPVDLAVICVPGEHVLRAAKDALAKGVRALCVISAGFAEVGSEGARRQDRLLALVRAHGARMIGPNCLGLASAGPRLNATFAGKAPRWGSIGFSSQSGALGLALIEAAEARGIGLSAFVSIGNKADVSSNDVLERFEDDESTNLIALYLESFGNPRRFARIARRVSRSKPILALKSGRTSAGAKAAGSHTAALTSSDVAVEALFHQAGVIRAETLEELVDASVLLSRQSLPRGRRVAVLTNAGGLGILAADACEASGLELPTLADESVARLSELLPVEASVANPVDMLGSATAATYEAVLPVLLEDQRCRRRAGAVRSARHRDRGRGRARGGAGRGRRRQACRRCGDGRTRDSARARRCRRRGVRVPRVGSACARPPARSGCGARPARSPRSGASTATPPGGVVAGGLQRAPDLWLDPEEARGLLEAYGIPVVDQRVAGTPDDAARFAAELGFPVVVKTALAGVHKTESGGVVLDLQTEDEVREAAGRIEGPVLVQPMRTGSAELLADLVQDELFGPLIALGREA